MIFGTATTPNLDDWLGLPTKDTAGREWPGDDNPTGIAHDAIGAVATGALHAPSFRDPVTAHFERDASGQVLVADPAALVPVTLVVPRAAPPASGYPVVIHFGIVGSEPIDQFHPVANLAAAIVEVGDPARRRRRSFMLSAAPDELSDRGADPRVRRSSRSLFHDRTRRHGGNRRDGAARRGLRR